MCIHISGKCERVSDNVPWPRHKIEAIADCLIRKKRLCLSGYVMSAQIISAFIFMIICYIANIAKVPYTVWPEILAGNLFWRIGGFESNPPIFHPPKTSQCDVIIIAKS